MAKQDKPVAAGSALLPTVNKPGTYEWCEEVVECMNMAWRSKETAEVAFLAAVQAAVQYRIWETLSPPPPEEPYTSLENLIRRAADPGQAENMQITIRFSGILENAGAQSGPEEGRGRALPAGTAPMLQTRADVQPSGGAMPRPLTEEDEIALGNALLDQYAAQTAAGGSDLAAAADAMAAAGQAVGLPPAPASQAAPVAPRRSAAERKRDRLERSHPELAEAVDAGEMTLKQAYIEAGIEKANPNLDKLQRLWHSASAEERNRFLDWIGEQETAERRREYEREVYGAGE